MVTGGVVVVTPTIPGRRRTRDATLAQWTALGLPVLVVEQDPGLPVGPASQLATAREALRGGVASGAAVVVYAEDDIDVDPRLLRMLPMLLGAGPCALWHRPRFRPARLPALGPDQVVVVPARAPRRWWGGQCVVATSAQAAAWAAVDYGRGGIDMGLRLMPGLRITVPALAAHRPLPRAATRGPRIDTDTYVGPRTQEDPC